MIDLLETSYGFPSKLFECLSVISEPLLKNADEHPKKYLKPFRRRVKALLIFLKTREVILKRPFLSRFGISSTL